MVDEDFEAWVHGPVISNVYQAYKGFGYSAIKGEYKEESASERLRRLLGQVNLEQHQKDIFFAVLGKYGALTSYQLELLSHSEDPWVEARKGLSPIEHSSAKIDKALMKEYYSPLVNAKK